MNTYTPTPKPEWVKGEYGVTYEDIVKSWGHEVLDISETGSYQGDYEVLLRDANGRYGITVFGYGSCSGCDELQATEPWNDEGDWNGVVELRDKLAADITWFDTPEAAAKWIDDALAENGNRWWAYDSEVRGVLVGYRKQIVGRP